MRIKIISVFLAVMTLLSIAPLAANATAGNEIAPYWQNTGAVSCKIGFPGDGYGYAEAHVMGHPTASKIQSDVYVYRQVGSSWVYVAEEHEIEYCCSSTISCQFTPIQGAYYRADYTFVVTKGEVDETITNTVYKTCS